MGQRWYDEKEGIENSIRTLAGLNKLEAERHAAGLYDRHEKLTEFVILGTYWLDSAGNCGRITDGKGEPFSAEMKKKLPRVATHDEFLAMVKTLGHTGSVSTSFESGIPTVDIVCPICGFGWSVNDCHDTVVSSRSEMLPMGVYVGMSLREVNEILGKAKDGHYRINSEPGIRNDAYIDVSLEYPGTDDEWKKGQIRNPRGYIKVNNSYIIRAGDEASVVIFTYRHITCERSWRQRMRHAEFREAFHHAGYKEVRMRSQPNEYDSKRSDLWYQVETEIGTLLIGWRSHVIHIGWDEVDSKFHEELENRFKKEGMTLWATGVHAENLEKFTEYLWKIREIVLKDKYI